MLSCVEDVHRARCNSIIAQSTSVYVMKNPGMGLCECGLGNGQRIESRDSNYKEVGGPYYTDTHLPHPSVCVFCLFLFLRFLGLFPRDMEIPRLGVESEL